MATSKAVIKKVVNHDSLSISAKFPSGASFRFSVTRSGERLMVAFSNDDTEANRQSLIMQKFAQCKGEETYLDVINRLEKVCEDCKSGSEVITKIEALSSLTMKTSVTNPINTLDEAKAFLTELHKNGESYHPEDDAHHIDWHTEKEPTDFEKDMLNERMIDIYNIPENAGKSNSDLGFDPCLFVMELDGHVMEN